MAALAWRLLSALLLGPGPDELAPPAPTIEQPIEQSIESSIEGPARPPESGIEFARSPAVEAEVEVGAEAGVEVEAEAWSETAEQPSWPTPGNAPPDGWGWITAGAIVIPTTALGTWALISETNRKQDHVGLLIGGSGLVAIGIAMIGTGAWRQAKLKRWTLAYRVVARPQGAGLINAGTLSAMFGGTLIGVGSVATARGYRAAGATMLALGATGVAVIAPLTIYFGKQRRQDYLATGGWYRPALPTVRLAPNLIVNDTTFALGVAGQF